MKVEKLDLPVKRNQAFIVTHFSKTREKFCNHLIGEGENEESSKKASFGDGGSSSQLGGESERTGSRPARKELLIKVACYLTLCRLSNIIHFMFVQADSGDADLCLLLSLTDLLASCSEGENAFIESVCQTIFSVDEVLDIIDCDFIVAERKRPFARFFTSVYLVNPASGQLSFGSRSIMHR